MMNYNNFSYGFMGIFPFFPYLPEQNTKPPTVYSILNSIVNFGKENQTKIKNLAEQGRSTIFDFDYPLSDEIEKPDFEKMILNHYMQRRIGFDTVTAFKLQLNVKLNEIMPFYNKMFDALEGWNIFTDGEIETKTGTITDNGSNSKTSETSKESSNSGTSGNQETTTTTIDRDDTNSKTSNNTIQETRNNTTSGSNQLTNSSETETNIIEDRKKSDMPYNQLTDIQSGNYLTDYERNSNNNQSTDSSTSTGTSSGTDNTTTNGTNNTIESGSNTTDETDTTTNTYTKTNSNTGNESINLSESGTNTNTNNYSETRTKNVTDKIALLKEYQTNIQNIYSMIFKDLDCLFYQII